VEDESAFFILFPIVHLQELGASEISTISTLKYVVRVLSIYADSKTLISRLGETARNHSGG